MITKLSYKEGGGLEELQASEQILGGAPMGVLGAKSLKNTRLFTPGR